ncbi:MAG: GYF domain-containing protein [Muribaculaceae bacterium]|nr:GYF domain-containing protein [Muribaculaceae bacterium]
MEKEYYIVEGDTRVGPLSIAQLSEKGIEPSTLVWTAGMSNWARADTVPELMPFLANRMHIDESESAFGPYVQPQQPAQPYQQPQQYGAYNNPGQGNGYSGSSNNWKTLAIIATVCGFLFACIGGIIGIFAILQANKAEEATRRGDFYSAQSSWSTCKTLTIISFVLSGLGLIYSGFVISQIFTTGLI